jgi:hypothetical protein
MRCLCVGLAAPERCLKESPFRQNTQHPRRSLDLLVFHGNGTLIPSGQVHADVVLESVQAGRAGAQIRRDCPGKPGQTSRPSSNVYTPHTSAVRSWPLPRRPVSPAARHEDTLRTATRSRCYRDAIVTLLLLAAQHVQQVVFTHRLGQRQASVLAARVAVEVRLVKNS